MSLYRGVNIVRNGLTLCVDPANVKSFKGEATTNLVTYSEDFTQAVWLKQNVVVTPEATLAPDGTITGDLISSSNTNDHQLFLPHNSSSAVRTLSVYVKKTTYRGCYLGAYNNGYAVYFDLNTKTISSIVGAGVTGNIEYVGNGWFRISATFPSIAVELHIGFLDSAYTGTNGACYAITTAVGTSGYIWGAQLEAKSYVTQYIKSIGSTGIRGNTIASGGGIVNLLNTSNGGDLLNGVAYSSKNKGYLIFDGVDDYVLSSANLGISGDANFTISYWAYWNDTTFLSNYPSGFGGNANGATGQNLSTTWYGGRIALDFWVNRFRTTNALSPMTWYMVTFTKTAGLIDSSHVKIYANTTELAGGTEGATTAPNIIDSPFVIGRLDGTRWFKGFIGEILVYNRAISAAENVQNFIATKSRYGL